ncbi:MAG: TetR/AcrR family transcriptional regulator [Negativicutes bacterium]|nr:TetR/AcrR family transcriptional regulator [Negativicutes bacterium]
MNYTHQGRPTDDTDSKRQHILDAAYKIFSLKGYNRATVDEIISLADTGKGTVYNYFGNKEQLFWSVIQERIQPFVTALEQIASTDQPVPDKIYAMVRTALSFYLENGDLWRGLIHEVWRISSEDVLKQAIREKYLNNLRRINGLIEQVLCEGVAQGVLRDYELKKAAYGLLSIIVTFVYQDLVGDDIDATATKITNVFLYGIAAS